MRAGKTPGLAAYSHQLSAAGSGILIFGSLIHLFTPALLSIGSLLIFLQWLFTQPFLGLRHIRFRDKGALFLLLYSLWITLSAAWSSDLNQAGVQIQLIAAIPLITLGFSVWRPSGKIRRRLMLLFIAAVTLAGVGAFVNYMLHFDEINASIVHSKPIPIISGANHIYFSISLALAALLCLYLLQLNSYSSPVQKWVIVLLLTADIVLLHSISARTGLFAFYGALATGSIYYMALHRKWKQGMFLLATACLLAGLSIRWVPSLRNRMENTLLDMSRIRQKSDPSDYSLGMRMESLTRAVEEIQKKPLTGYGVGSEKQVMENAYVQSHSQLKGENRILPHNQFVISAMEAGIPAVLLLLVAIFAPLAAAGSWHDKLPYFIFVVIYLLGFQAEALLQRQAGLCIFILFYFLLQPDPSRPWKS